MAIDNMDANASNAASDGQSAPQPPSGAAEASTSPLDQHTTSPQKPRIELLSDDDSGASSALSDAPIKKNDDNPSNAEAVSNIHDDPSTAKQTASTPSTPAKPTIFLKSSKPDIPLHIHLPPELNGILNRKISIAVRSHGGVMESRFGKADLIAVDPKMVSVSKKTFKEANQMGQPIPVVTLDYIYDSIARGERIDFDDPKYRYNATRPQLAPAVTAKKDNSAASRSFGGRNPFTESDREAIIAYFIDKPEASWSLNTAARELAKSNPTHTHSSYQSYLQNNFERGWNLKEQVLLARRAALEDETSELQARILRLQYTASPGPAEQSAPSDGWPRTSSAPSQQGSEEQPSRHRQEQEAPHEEASPAEDDDEDLQVRQPNPGAAVHDVDKSPTKANKPVVYASSDHSGSRQNSVEPPPSGQRMTIPASPPVEEESDPNDFSPTILDQIERAERLKSSQPKPSQKQRRARHSSDSSDDSELDQLDADSDEDMLTTGPAALAPEVERNGADASEDSEWEGTRRAENKMREKDDSFVREKRIKFTKEEKDELLRDLVDHVLSKGRAPDVFTQEAILAKPEDAFWAQFAQDNPTHSLASWRSHYLKNRATYKQMIDLMIADRIEATEGSQAGEDGDNVDEEEGEEQSMAVETAEELDQSNEQPPNEQNSDADENVLLKELQSATRKPDDPSMKKSNLVPHLEDMSLPADGIVVMIPTQPVQDQRRPRRTKPQPTQKQQWPQAPTPPLMEEEEQEDMMQVEAEIDAVADEPDRAPNGSNDDITSSREDIQGLHEQPAAVEGLDSAESMEEGEAPVISLGKTPSTSALPKASTPTRSIQPPQKKGVDAGMPVLSQHRDAPFYDFTIDSDEEHRIRKARSRPSLPNLPSSRQEATASRTSRSPITSKRVLSHFATPSRSRTHADNVRKDQTPQQQQREDDRTESIREWARSVSTTPSSASPDLLKDAGPVVIAETSRSRASRIDRRPLLSAERAPNLAPQLLQSVAKTTRRVSGERASTALPTTSPTPARGHHDRSAASLKRSARASELDREAARLHFRAEVERLRGEFSLNMLLTRELLLLFRGRVKDARTWLGTIRDEYGVDAEVAFEYLRTSNGDLAQAENYLRLATVVTRSSSAPRFVSGTSSRSASHSVSPFKRPARSEERSFSRINRESGRADSSKRFRR